MYRGTRLALAKEPRYEARVVLAGNISTHLKFLGSTLSENGVPTVAPLPEPVQELADLVPRSVLVKVFFVHVETFKDLDGSVGV